MKHIFFASLFLLAGCAASSSSNDASGSDESALTGAAGDAVAVTATWTRAVTGTPTYGDDATTPFVDVALAVTDDLVRRDHPSFDGLERPFVLVPRADGSTSRLALSFTGTSMEGYIALHPVDHYELPVTALSDADLAAVLAKGVVVAVDTNVGELSTGTIPVTAKR